MLMHMIMSSVPLLPQAKVNHPVLVVGWSVSVVASLNVTVPVTSYAVVSVKR